jgi:hypothetical protein
MSLKFCEALGIAMSRYVSKIALYIVGICLCYSVAGCIEKEGSMPQKPIEQVQLLYSEQWMAIPGVEGIAIGQYKDKPCILIFSSVEPKKLRDKIPSSVEGYPVIIEQTGAFKAL